MSLNTELNKIQAFVSENRFEEAMTYASKVPMPEATRLAVNGTIDLKRGALQEAEVNLSKALEIESGNILANANYATLLITQKKLKRALPYAELAYRAMPKNLNFTIAYVACLADADRHDEAVAVLSPFAKKEKPPINVLVTYSSLLRASMKPEEAMLALDKATELYPNDPNAQRAIAEAYAELDPRLAKAEFDKTFASQSESLPLRWNASFVELRLGNFQRGWELYEAGLDDKIGKIGRPLPAQVRGFPRITDFESMDPDKWTLFSCEQGLGDQILFLGAFEEAIRQHPKSAIIGEDRMLSLLQRSFPGVSVYSYGFASGLTRQKERINGVFPIGSLMKHFRQSAGTFEKSRRAYLIPDERRVTKYRQILETKLRGKKLIGVSWRGGFWERQKKTKSFEFETLMQLAQEDAHFISLQYGDVTEERAVAKRQSLPITFIEGIDFKKDIEGWFALSCACDQITSVSTALVHFAGAAGKKVDLLLGEYQAPFIWGVDTGPSIAYANVHIHRKKKDESVVDYMSRVKEIL
jgi:tetratricopeptide (TPR) repeat protein